MIRTRSRGIRRLMLAAMIPLFPMLGCASNNTDRGILGGGALGAVVGALAAGPRHALGGALIGGAAGAALGGVAGASADNSERKMAVRQANQRALALQDIVALNSSGSSDEVIISQIRNSGCVYNLRANEVIWLQDSGVREPVIRYMQATSRMVPVYEAVQPVYVVQPAPPIGFGVGVQIR